MRDNKKVFKINPSTVVKNGMIGKVNKIVTSLVLNAYGALIKEKLMNNESYSITFDDSDVTKKKVISIMVVQMKSKTYHYVLEPRLKVVLFTSGQSLNKNRIVFRTAKKLQKIFWTMPIEERIFFPKE